MSHAEFLELVLADEVSRRESTSAERRSRAAGLDPAMTSERWDESAKVHYDHAIWHELCSLQFIDGGHSAGFASSSPPDPDGDQSRPADQRFAHNPGGVDASYIAPSATVL